MLMGNPAGKHDRNLTTVIKPIMRVFGTVSKLHFSVPSGGSWFDLAIPSVMSSVANHPLFFNVLVTPFYFPL